MMKAAQANAVILHIVYKTLLPVFIVILCTTGCYTILSPLSEYMPPEENQLINETDDSIIVTNKYINNYNYSNCRGYDNYCSSIYLRYNSWTGTYYCDPYYYNFSYYNHHHNNNWWFSNNNWNNDNYSDNNSSISPKKTKLNRSYSRNSSYSVDTTTSQENTQTNNSQSENSSYSVDTSKSQNNTQTNTNNNESNKSNNKPRRKHNRRPL